MQLNETTIFFPGFIIVYFENFDLYTMKRINVLEKLHGFKSNEIHFTAKNFRYFVFELFNGNES